MSKFTLHEPVTVVFPNSPFHLWAGTVEQVGVGEAFPAHYVVKITYRGLGIGPVLMLTFREAELRAGLPVREDCQARNRGAAG